MEKKVISSPDQRCMACLKGIAPGISVHAKQLPFILCFFVSFLTVNTIFGQAMSETALQEKFNFYNKAHPSSLLFVHTDKTVYTNNETIWFNAYLVRTGSSSSKAHSLLSVALVREDNRKVWLANRYVMENGLSPGSLTLPDSIPPGNYQFVAATNLLDKRGQPVAMFTQSITIKSITVQDFTSTLTLLDSVVAQGAIRAKVSIAIKDPNPKEGITIRYTVGKEAEQSVILEREQRECLITIPQEQLNQFKPALHTSVKYKKQIQYLSVKLPEVKPMGINVRFYPEGGNLAAGLENLVGWEARTAQDLPLGLKGILYRDDQPIDTIATTSYGSGTFRFRPDNSSRYTLKVAANSYLKKDTVYMLPPPIENGVVLQVTEAIVKDTLRINLRSKVARNVQVLLHDYRELYASLMLQAQPSGQKVSLALGPLVPKGIIALTVLDEEGRPLAERLVFVHYDQGITADLQADKALYNRKEEVHVKLKLTDKTGKPLPGIVSVACVQDNRLESSKLQDIESYVHLRHDLGTLPSDPQGSGMGHKEYLENILLIKGWRRYTWQDLVNSTAADTLAPIQAQLITGNVKYGNKPLKKPVGVSVLRDATFSLLNTGNDGSFELNRNNSMIAEGRRLALSVNQKFKEGYTIEVNNPFRAINQQLAGQLELPNLGLAQHAQSSKDAELKGMERVIALKEVVVSVAKSDLVYGMGARAGRNDCGDYVCIYNILNCPVHPLDKGNRSPVQGERYFDYDKMLALGIDAQQLSRTVPSGIYITYIGCTESSKTVFKIDGIYTSKEFYGVNTDPVGLLETQFLSTLFWKPNVVVGNQGEAEFSFMTGDITGKFRIVVQGVGAKDVVFGEGKFMVK